MNNVKHKMTEGTTSLRGLSGPKRGSEEKNDPRRKVRETKKGIRDEMTLDDSSLHP